MALIQSIHTVFDSFEEAAALAAKLTADDVSWKYVAVADPLFSGRAIINIEDEDGVVVGNL